jgi:hypothetical protein
LVCWKASLIGGTCTKVDRHVRSLDLAIKAEEATFALGLRPGTLPLNSVLQNGSTFAFPALLPQANGFVTTEEGERSAGGGNDASFDESGNLIGASQHRQKKKPPKRARPRDSSNANANPPVGADAENRLPGILPLVSGETAVNGLVPAPILAIDPNEPRYCYCDQVSFGEVCIKRFYTLTPVRSFRDAHSRFR